MPLGRNKKPQHAHAEKLLIVMPHRLSECVMATPTLRAFRQLYPDAQITALIRRHLRPAIDGCPWVDRIASVRKKIKGVGGKSDAPLKVAARIASARFDTAVLLPNSFRSALLARTARIPRRVGYDRDGRGGLLTDRLLPRRVQGKYIPLPLRDYYLGLARYLGAVDPDPAMQVFTRPSDDAKADELLSRAGYTGNGAGGDARPLVLLCPGDVRADARMWLPQRFGELADMLVKRLGCAVALSAGPDERRGFDEARAAVKEKIIDLPALGVDLTLLKSVIRRASLVITGDTGPRQIAAALGVPAVSILGPTDDVWSTTHSPLDHVVAADVYCRPCGKKKCPLRRTPDDHICMKRIEVDIVFAHAARLLGARQHQVQGV